MQKGVDVTLKKKNLMQTATQKGMQLRNFLVKKHSCIRVYRSILLHFTIVGIILGSTRSEH